MCSLPPALRGSGGLDHQHFWSPCLPSKSLTLAFSLTACVKCPPFTDWAEQSFRFLRRDCRLRAMLSLQYYQHILAANAIFFINIKGKGYRWWLLRCGCVAVLCPKPSCVVLGELGLSSVCLQPLRRALVCDGNTQKTGAPRCFLLHLVSFCWSFSLPVLKLFAVTVSNWKLRF